MDKVPDIEAPFPERRQDLDHRDLQKYMDNHKIKLMLTQMISYLVEKRSEDHLQGAIDFLKTYKPPN